MKFGLHATLQGHRGAVQAVAFSRDGRRLVSGGFDGKLVSWDLSKKTTIRTVTVKGHVEDVAFIDDGDVILVASMYENKLKEWDMAAGTLVKAWGAHTSWPRLAVAKSAPIAVTKGREGAIATVWDVLRRKKLGQLKGHKFGLDSWEPSQNGTKALTVGWFDRTLRHWDLAKLRETWKVERWAGGGRVAWSPDGDRFVAAGETLSVRAASRGAAVRWEVKRSAISSVVWTSTDVILTSHEGSVDTVDAANGAVLASMAIEQKPTRALAASGDGSLVAVGTEAGVIYVARLRR